MRVRQGRLIFPLLVAVIVAAALIGHARNTASQSATANTRLTLSRGIHATNTGASDTPFLSPSPKPSPAPTPNPTPKPVATPAPTPPSQASVNAEGQAGNDAQQASCSDLLSQWQQTLASANWQLSQGKLLMLDLGQRNAAIDSYNQTVQAAYNTLLTETKSAQCSLRLDAPKVVQHMH